MPLFHAEIDYRTGFCLEAPDLDEARRMALRIAINQITSDAVIDLTSVEERPPSPDDAQAIEAPGHRGDG